MPEEEAPQNETTPQEPAEDPTSDAALDKPEEIQTTQFIQLQIRLLLPFSVLLAFLGATIYALQFKVFFSTDAEFKNQIGSYLGGTVSSIWSLAGLILIYVAFLGQRVQIINQERDLRQNRTELKLTRKTLQGQEAELKVQSETSVKQRFENTYFSLLTLHNSIVTSLVLNGVEVEVQPNSRKMRGVATGREVFQFLYSNLETVYKSYKKMHPNSGIEKEIQETYRIFYDRHQNDLGHYFRNLYNIVKFIDRSAMLHKDREFYINILRAQLSINELRLLFYNCLSATNGRFRFKPLIEKYNLLEGLNPTQVLFPDHFSIYSSSAFKAPKGDDE